MIVRLEFDGNDTEPQRRDEINRTRAGIAHALIKNSEIALTGSVMIHIAVRKQRNCNNNPIDVYYVAGTITKV